jgi:hypothetical protein
VGIAESNPPNGTVRVQCPVTPFHSRHRKERRIPSTRCLLLPEYDNIVANGARVLLSKLGDHGALVICVLTLIALSIFPLPFCVACEFPNPWGHVAVWPEVPVSIWLVTAPSLAGLFALRRGWLVPIWVVFALLATQPLGGVELVSLRENEGPVIIGLGLPVTAACLGVGYVIRVVVVFTKAIITSRAV